MLHKKVHTQLFFTLNYFCIEAQWESSSWMLENRVEMFELQTHLLKKKNKAVDFGLCSHISKIWIKINFWHVSWKKPQLFLLLQYMTGLLSALTLSGLLSVFMKMNIHQIYPAKKVSRKSNNVESGMIIAASSYLTKKELSVSGTSFFSKIWDKLLWAGDLRLHRPYTKNVDQTTMEKRKKRWFDPRSHKNVYRLS